MRMSQHFLYTASHELQFDVTYANVTAFLGPRQPGQKWPLLKAFMETIHQSWVWAMQHAQEW